MIDGKRGRNLTVFFLNGCMMQEMGQWKFGKKRVYVGPCWWRNVDNIDGDDIRDKRYLNRCKYNFSSATKCNSFCISHGIIAATICSSGPRAGVELGKFKLMWLATVTSSWARWLATLSSTTRRNSIFILFLQTNFSIPTAPCRVGMNRHRTVWTFPDPHIRIPPISEMLRSGFHWESSFVLGRTALEQTFNY